MPRVLCPSCGKAGSVPEGLKGRIKCPACGERFAPPDLSSPPDADRVQAVVEPDPAPAPSPPVESVLSRRWNSLLPLAQSLIPKGRAESEVVPAAPAATPTKATKDCPFCGEAILVVARKCKHCGEMLDPKLRAAEEAKRLAEARSQQAAVAAPQQVVQQSVVVKVEGKRRRVPHLIHFLLTVVTLGAWFPIWMIHWVLNWGRD